MPKTYRLNGQPLTNVKVLGASKRSRSYLLADQKKQYVCKQILSTNNEYEQPSHEIFQHELKSYKTLSKTVVNIPKLLEANPENEYFIREFIDGDLVSDLVSCGAMTTDIFMKAFEFSEALKKEDINLDYFPSNFVVRDKALYYIDNEYNEYLAEWDFTHWGIYYWLNQEGMKLFNETKRLDLLHQTFRPRTLGFENTVAELKALYQHNANRPKLSR